MSVTRQMRRHQERMARKGRGAPAAPAPKPSPDDPKIERLVSVAFVRDGETHHGFKAHWELRASLGDANPQKALPGDEAGFWTSFGRFVTRDEAVPIAVEAGQISASWLRGGRELLSSDVW